MSEVKKGIYKIVALHTLSLLPEIYKLQVITLKILRLWYALRKIQWGSKYDPSDQKIVQFREEVGGYQWAGWISPNQRQIDHCM